MSETCEKARQRVFRVSDEESIIRGKKTSQHSFSCLLGVYPKTALTDEQQAAGVMACAALGCVALATVALLALLAWALWG